METRKTAFRRLAPRFAAGIAAVLVLALGTAAYLDYRSFDRTSGGYDPPYTDWTGTPIDWDTHERTDNGFRQSGLVINSKLDCTSGMISFEVAGVNVNFRKVSERAIAVHQPREACEAHGFDPEF